jgi:fibronectin-binding autotransporter adhesin
MKTRLKWLKSIPLLCSALAATAAFGQTTYNWTNSAGGDLATAANWSPNGVPFIGANAVMGDTMQFDGLSTGPVDATSNTGAQTGSSVGGTIAGIYVRLTANQTSPVTFYTTVANSASSGIRFNSILIDAGAGSFILGKNSTTNCLDTLWGTTNPQGHSLSNNSVNPAIILPDVRWRLGAGGAHTFIFSGTGDWNVTNDIANVNGAASLVAKDGPGTMRWSAGNNAFWGTKTTIASPLTLSGGTLILHSSGLFPATTTINTTAGTLLKLDVVGGSQTIANPVNGGGNIQVHNGTLTLSGQNTYTGDTLLSGGTLVANRAENLGVNGALGVGGVISFTGGTLAFSSVNSYDYSPRFTNTAGQTFSFDTAGQNVIFTNGLASSGGTLTKLGSGTLTLTGANTYDGTTTVGAGKLLIQGTHGTAAITVSNNATLGANQGGQQINPTTLTVGTSGGAALEFNNVNNTVTPAILAGTLVAGGTITVNISGGSFAIGTAYPLLQWTSGTFTAGSFALGSVTGAGGNLSVTGNTLYLNVTALASKWTGATDAIWSATSGTVNWIAGVSPSQWINGAPALFDDTASTANTNITLGSTVVPNGVTANNSTVPYSITVSPGNVISGSTGLTKTGNGTLVLAGGVNTYSGATTISGGTLSVGTLADGGAVSDIGASGNGAANLVLNGGALQYTGTGASAGVNRLFTLGTAGGTIDSSGADAVVLNNTGAAGLSGSGARTLTLTGTDAGGSTLAASLADSGGATALTKSGAGMWIVAGNNAISGPVTINEGTLQVGNGGATGSVGSGSVSLNAVAASLTYNRTGTVTNGTVSGTGSVTVGGGVTVVLPNNNSYSGGTTINSDSKLQVGVGGAAGALAANATITVDGTLDFNTSGTVSYAGTGIAGGGNVIVRGNGTIISVGANSYGGWTQINPGSTFQPCQGNQGALASSTVTNNGTLRLIRQDNGVFIYAGPIVGSGRVLVDANNFNPGDVTLTADSTYTGGTIIGNNGLVIGDGSTVGSITGNVIFTNSTQVPNDNARFLTFNRSDDIIFPGLIVTNFSSPQVNLGSVRQIGTGKLTLTGANTFGSGVVVSNGTLQVGNGGTTGSIGNGAAQVFSFLSFNRSDSLTFGGGISGTGVVAQAGSGVLNLTGAVAMSLTLFETNTDEMTFTNIFTNVFVGTLAASNGTLVANGGAMTALVGVHGGTFAPASLSAGGSLTVSSNLTISAGTILVPLNKSLLPQTNIIVGGSLTRTGGSVVVTNAGPALAVNDKFYLFNKPVSGFATVTGAGATWQNDLAIDGSITALTVPTPPVNTNPPVLLKSVSGSTLTLGWPTNLGWTLQTNSVGLTAAGSWFAVPGSSVATNMSFNIDNTKTNVFFRMVYP